MEFPNLGKRCEMKGCGLVDFLPFNCRYCKAVFCVEHRQTFDHLCPSNKTRDRRPLFCPIVKPSLLLSKTHFTHLFCCVKKCEKNLLVVSVEEEQRVVRKFIFPHFLLPLKPTCLSKTKK